MTAARRTARRPEPKRCEHTGAIVTDAYGHSVHVEDSSPCHGPRGHILQLIPTQGWRALYAWDQEGKAVLDAVPLAALALVEYCDGKREVGGLVFLGKTIAEPVQAGEGFRRMLRPGEEPTPEDHRDSEEYVQRQRERQRVPKGAAP